MGNKKKICNKIKNEIDDFLTYINSFGNECAYTDRMIENIIELAKELEKEAEKDFPKEENQEGEEEEER